MVLAGRVQLVSAFTSSHSTAADAESYSASISATRIHPPCNRKPKREVRTAECTTKSPTRLGVWLLLLEVPGKLCLLG